MHKKSYYIINGITMYRVVASFFLLLLIILNELDTFKWLLAVSFFTDAIDGYLARRYKVTSRLGATLDSIGDDLTVITGIIGLFVFKGEFVRQHLMWLVFLFALFIVQIALAFIRYRKITSFHTYFAKLAALLQGSFLILAFFMEEPVTALFFIAFAVTAIDLTEEIILVLLLPKAKTNVKGIYWILKQRNKAHLLIFPCFFLG